MKYDFFNSQICESQNVCHKKSKANTDMFAYKNFMNFMSFNYFIEKLRFFG